MDSRAGGAFLSPWMRCESGHRSKETFVSPGTVPDLPLTTWLPKRSMNDLSGLISAYSTSGALELIFDSPAPRMASKQLESLVGEYWGRSECTAL